ncbi:tRNA threonylcarbamoyladenosine biosynthesis protein TsaB [Spiroplasma chinense]|uniref:tRNA threonylcarbamoyladenosine biosynthesis protein TsaB n=1 Tax=Spiroplasma chinense TaxID=216932 RepID=A0A5B9Y4A0_9MOLU|nr:tRNA (adenosine(37)-N6)-threonylcarbamoyltransferase complex dimerization subunit type 1 TsaB [Spiroplasma chinense]QEH61496.1 tRNA threonylcarbamoyladenosine biosynthesis protein TsaB [Spiroplasma chinense]
MNLFIDTTNNNLILILENKNQIIDSVYKTNQMRISDIVMDELKNMLDKNNLKIKEIDSVYCSNGPGSYTGVRVGITIAKTLKILNPSLKVFTLSSLAFQAGNDNVISLLDAKGKKFYIGIYESGVCKIADQLIPEDYLEEFKDQFGDFEIRSDYKDIDYINNYLSLKEKFELNDDVEKIEPIYIKNFI